MHPVSVAERLAFGRVEDPERDHIELHLATRPKTALFGRTLLAAIFVVSGLAKVLDPTGSIAAMEKHGIPEADTLVWIAGFAELAGAASLITGFLARLGAIGLILFLIPTTLIFHDFWSYSGAEQVPQMSSFLKNVGLAGGLALLIAYGPGRWSLDHKLRWPIRA